MPKKTRPFRQGDSYVPSPEVRLEVEILDAEVRTRTLTPQRDGAADEVAPTSADIREDDSTDT